MTHPSHAHFLLFYVEGLPSWMFVSGGRLTAFLDSMQFHKASHKIERSVSLTQSSRSSVVQIENTALGLTVAKLSNFCTLLDSKWSGFLRPKRVTTA